MTDILLPCPFCGHQASMCGTGHGFVVSCNNEDCQIYADSYDFKNEHDAATLWNTRSSGWIRIQDRLPPFNTGVLITDGDVITVAQLDKDHVHPESYGILWGGWGFGGYEWEWDFQNNSITHWMPLPEPPVEGV